MRKIIYTLVVACSVTMSSCQAQKTSNSTAGNYTYETECMGTEMDGSQTLKSWGNGRNYFDASTQAKKNAVHGIIFQGYAGGGQGCTSQKPLCSDPSIEQQKEEFFSNFFNINGGKYMKFVSNSGDSTPTVKKVGKEYKIGVVVTVMSDNLRKDLEAAGIVRGLSSGF